MSKKLKVLNFESFKEVVYMESFEFCPMYIMINNEKLPIVAFELSKNNNGEILLKLKQE